jgi:hypothetical protein
MKMQVASVVGLLFVAPLVSAQDKDVPDAARREIERRGYLVQKIDGQIGDSTADVLAEVLAVPEDDSHKFTLTILYGAHRNAQLDRLKEHLLSAKELQPWVRCKDRGKGSYDVASTSESHLHCRFDQHKSPFVPEQWSGIKVVDYPTLLLQPSRNGQWGPPETVINQRTGYDGDPARLAEWIKGSIGKYVLAYSRTPEYQAARTDAKQGHAEQPEAGRYPAPFPVPPKELPRGAEPAFPFPPDLVPVEPEPVRFPILNWLIGSGVLVLLLHMALSYFGAYAKTTPTPVDDVAVQIAGKVLDALEQRKQRPVKKKAA